MSALIVTVRWTWGGYGLLPGHDSRCPQLNGDAVGVAKQGAGGECCIQHKGGKVEVKEDRM